MFSMMKQFSKSQGGRKKPILMVSTSSRFPTRPTYVISYPLSFTHPQNETITTIIDLLVLFLKTYYWLIIIIIIIIGEGKNDIKLILNIKCYFFW